MESKWRKAKKTLGLKLCVHTARDLDDDALPSAGEYSGRSSGSAAAAPVESPASSAAASDFRSPSVSTTPTTPTTPSTPTPTTLSGPPRLSKSGSKSSSKKTCTICLGTMKPGHGHALFTAECSHTFHFHCITSNVKHGNHVCPVCRAKWKEVPCQSPSTPSDQAHGRSRISPVNVPQEDALLSLMHRLPRSNNSIRQQYVTPPEPNVFDDDEPLDLRSETSSDSRDSPNEGAGTVELKIYPEFSAIPQSDTEENFNILVHLKAPTIVSLQTSSRNAAANSITQQTLRAPIDLVTVLDVSGSMSGTKLALLKQAMGFVIQNLGPSDRLSVIAFSSTARRLFRLCHMSDSGKQVALQAVNSLVSNGGTNIVEGLRKGVKVIEECKEKNPVRNIVLLSDGQDTYNAFSPIGTYPNQHDVRLLLPSSICGGTTRIPVHTFGFGDDHDSVSMHAISEISGGTFSYIEAESVIQDAFAQCIGGLLSVVVQDMHVKLEAVHPNVCLKSIKSGSYSNVIAVDGRTGSINVGDLYAEEERDFLMSVSIPAACEETILLKVCCVYKDPVSKEMVNVEVEEVKIQRPMSITDQITSVELDRQRNRLLTAESMAEARSAAERGAISEASTILEDRRRLLLESQAGLSGDQLCISLSAELREVQERMASQQLYELSGRAYVLSGLSSHSWQRATARGDSTHSTSLVQAYQTPSMVDMLQRSQTLGPPRQAVSQPILPTRSFNLRPQPR